VPGGRAEEHETTPVERVIGRGMEEAPGIGRPLSERARQRQRSVESYLRQGSPPRWMERIAEIDRGIAAHRRRLERAHRALAQDCGADAAAFARRWTELARAWSFGELNELIEQHNEWYPVERDLPMDLRTRDYVLINGRSYRRPLLGPDWILEQFPPQRG
jgi:hypothetical protein